jgi:hypothetical protein
MSSEQGPPELLGGPGLTLAPGVGALPPSKTGPPSGPEGGEPEPSPGRRKKGGPRSAWASADGPGAPPARGADAAGASPAAEADVASAAPAAGADAEETNVARAAEADAEETDVARAAEADAEETEIVRAAEASAAPGASGVGEVAAGSLEAPDGIASKGPSTPARARPQAAADKPARGKTNACQRALAMPYADVESTRVPRAAASVEGRQGPARAVGGDFAPRRPSPALRSTAWPKRSPTLNRSGPTT